MAWNVECWNDDKCRCECKELIDKGVCDKRFIWNLSNCECECCKSCDFSEYLDYKSCKCKKRFADKLVEECTKNIDKVNVAEVILTENMRKCISCILYIVLFSINVGISTYFVYYKYVNWLCLSSNKLLIQMGNIKQIYIKNRTCYFHNDIINIEEFNSSLLKIDKKLYVYYIGYITIKKSWWLGKCLLCKSFVSDDW